MNWTYQQSTGAIADPSGSPSGTGYSGADGCKNDPAAQDQSCRGPIPAGDYDIDLTPFDSPAHGPFVLRLTPDPENEMFGRSGFLIHGDSAAHPGKASEGCIILARSIRETISASGVNRLTVIS